ncbi:MAG: serine/threonine protein kinase [Paludibacterium sp.]|uniref:serine/threonine protein kinase n=1 Tax=Paludibacterium sp. TaxID=1917523 RepID=UPI0025D07E22|nr:serine/threonine protein kinase [Paludibacterium sp.]MBV8047305.1 serine/threonine protein kinase [Paludibacterium sp.]MBV8646630.1 serine/threonine protein kinase [Paludibacterium sp.]
MELTPHPFDGLTPDTLLDAVESLGLRASGSLLALNSYENRVYQIGMEEGPPLVAKFYRPARWSDAQILEEHAFVAELAAREIPVVDALSFDGRTLHQHGGFRFALFPRRGGRTPDFDQSDTLTWMGRFLGRIHAVGATVPYLERPALTIDRFGEQSLDWLLANDWLPAELREVYRGVARQALDGVSRAFERAGRVQTLRLHGDCHAGNVLWTDDGPHFVDFDDSRSGPAVQDLWMLLSGERADQSRQLKDLLAGYEDFFEFDDRELHLVEALRTLRLMHYSAWLARRWQDPAFPAAFPWFGGVRYWQDRILELREQIALMDEPPLIGGLY